MRGCSWVVLAAGGLFLLVACGGDKATTGEPRAVVFQADGSTTLNGHGCSWNGVTGYIGSPGQYDSSFGDTFHAAVDDCNDCSCTEQGIVCTTRTCVGCTYDGEAYADMATFPATDGCNDCVCRNGIVVCSVVACNGH